MAKSVKGKIKRSTTISKLVVVWSRCSVCIQVQLQLIRATLDTLHHFTLLAARPCKVGKLQLH